jgi:uridine kinase
MQETDSLTHSKSAAVRKCLIVGICGGSGSGKTTMINRLIETFQGEASSIFQDSYYIDQSANFKEDGGEINFDHPSSIEFSLLAKHLKQLKALKSVEIPIYDFVTHTRKDDVEMRDPARVILVDGTLILSQEIVRSLFDYSIFLQVPEHIRFERRKDRDMKERGRHLDGIVRQFYNHVKPMHDEFVEPSKIFADAIFSETHEFEKAYQTVMSTIEKSL